MSGHLQNKVGHFDGVSHAARQIPTNKNILLVVTWFQPIWFFFARQKWESSPSRGKHNKNMFELPAPRNPCFGVCTGLEWAALPPLLLQAWTNIKMSCFSWIYPPPPTQDVTVTTRMTAFDFFGLGIPRKNRLIWPRLNPSILNTYPSNPEINPTIRTTWLAILLGLDLVAQLNLCGPRDFLLQLEEVKLEELRGDGWWFFGHQIFWGKKIMEKTWQIPALRENIWKDFFPSINQAKSTEKEPQKLLKNCWDWKTIALGPFGALSIFSGANPRFLSAFALFSIFGF